MSTAVGVDPVTGGPCQHVARTITDLRESGVVVWRCRDCGTWHVSRTIRDFDASMPSADYLRSRAQALAELRPVDTNPSQPVATHTEPLFDARRSE